MNGSSLNLEAIVAIIVSGFAAIVGALAAFIVKLYKAKAEYVRATKEASDETIKAIKSNEEMVDRLTRGFKLYVENNGVPPEIKQQVREILENGSEK